MNWKDTLPSGIEEFLKVGVRVGPLGSKAMEELSSAPILGLLNPSPEGL